MAAGLLAGGIITWSLLFSAAFGMGDFFSRAPAKVPAGTPQLENLTCIEEAIHRVTADGATVKVEVGGDPYLWQRTLEVAFPRLNVVAGGDVPTLHVETVVEPTGAARCGSVEIWLQP